MASFHAASARDEALPLQRHNLSVLNGRALGRTSSGASAAGLLPGTDAALLRSRSDFGSLIYFQEGEAARQDSIEEEEAGEAEAAEAAKGPEIRKIFGMDQRPMYPTILIGSLLWSMSMTSMQCRVVEHLMGPLRHTQLFFVVIYATTICTMAYVSLCDPGLLSREACERLQREGGELPKRAFKHWLYKRPVLRFHQYCRWVTNAIGLRNHREYMVMLVGFVCMSLLDVVVDAVHVLLRIWRLRLLGADFFSNVAIVLHLVYSCYFAWYTIPLLRQHVGFMCRNELTKEWQRDDFQVIHREDGETVPVVELDVEDYNDYFDSFVYDSKLNPWDKGWVQNCLTFWLTPRWSPSCTGEF
eukprot:TRINITY_DN21921_c0_g1_i2.p1 TRINITY_DN21921_c0_g1~~TRINITY_DN21921_c0_g1_i2.p1  ORF type:complete len:372 (-),score=78.06 TRINITY_DN21921_c0_g1_i2:107-1177(-)